MKLSKSEAGKLGGIKSKQISEEKKLKRIIAYETSPSKCKNCATSLPYTKRHNSFCSKSCSVTLSNIGRRKNSNNACLSCSIIIGNGAKYCSVKCQHQYQYKTAISEWLSGKKSAGIAAIKRYLTETLGYRCTECGISDYNGKPITLELEHKDGNSANNDIHNLCFLCPNCHSQTDTYKAKNKGNGRHSRRVRYAEGKSY
jgi:predicted nucleic acid-binding Zn ribbon protein